MSESTRAVSGTAKKSSKNTKKSFNLSKQDTPKILFGVILGLVISLTVVGLTYLAKGEDYEDTLELTANSSVTEKNVDMKNEEAAPTLEVIEPTVMPSIEPTLKPTVEPTIEIQTKEITFSAHRDYTDYSLAAEINAEIPLTAEYIESINPGAHNRAPAIEDKSFKLSFEMQHENEIYPYKEVHQAGVYTRAHINEGNEAHYVNQDHSQQQESINRGYCLSYDDKLSFPCGDVEYVELDESGKPSLMIRIICEEKLEGGFEQCDEIMRTIEITKTRGYEG